MNVFDYSGIHSVVMHIYEAMVKCDADGDCHSKHCRRGYIMYSIE